MQEDLFVGEIIQYTFSVFLTRHCLICSNKKVTYVVRKIKNQSNIE